LGQISKAHAVFGITRLIEVSVDDRVERIDGLDQRF
jgi:hypothetical protein